MKSDKLLNKRQEGSMPQPGNEDDLVAMMQRLNLPMDRETYLDLAYFGEPPEELSAEQEAELPEQFRQE